MLALAMGMPPDLLATESSSGDLYYVLLRNGEVLRGSLERDGDHYMVRRDGSAELRIPYKDISHVGPTMQVLYEHKANRIIEFRADEHLHLASWCLQNKLQSQATHHILRAETIDPFHPHLSLMKARLERFLTVGDEANTPESEIALMAAVGNQPIPITREPLHEIQASEDSLTPTSTPTASPPTVTSESSQPATSPSTSTAIESDQPTKTPTADIPIVDPPELISNARAVDLNGEVELPDLIPAGGGPPSIPALTVNQELIRQVEERLADVRPKATAEPKKLVSEDVPQNAEPLRQNEPLDSPALTSDQTSNAIIAPPAEESADVTAEQETDQSGVSESRFDEGRPTTRLARTSETPSHDDSSSHPGQDPHVADATNRSAIVEQVPPRSLPESLSESPYLTPVEIPVEIPVEQQHQTDDVPNVELPPELIRAYVANIQPMLLTRCAAANCHGHATESEFKLHRVSDRRPSRVMTMRNLASTLEQLDSSNPAGSPLFTWGQAIHGQTHSKLLVISNVEQQKLLLDWIRDVAEPPSKVKPIHIDLADDRQQVFAKGAERISLRKIKHSRIRWRDPSPRAKQQWKTSEPANRESTDVQFLATPRTAEPANWVPSQRGK